ncbi:unnamed protein product [Orchesella dallaii]|uniref:Uncharacterized protein n=1 Tax=Orchesella dallaii TaxID=48710 RepID=A0ABP1PRU5_9HEXA
MKKSHNLKPHAEEATLILPLMAPPKPEAALAAGLTLTFLCGFMTLQGSLTNLFGGTTGGSKDTSLLSGLKESLGLPGSNRLNTNSDFGNSGGGYLPPKSSSDVTADGIDLTTPLFRIFLLSTSSTTPSPPTNETFKTLEIVTEAFKTESSSSFSRTTTAIPTTIPSKQETTNLNIDTPSTPISVPAPMAPPIIMSLLSGQGDRSTAKVPITTLQPPSESSTTESINPDAENNLNDDMPDTNILKPGYILKPPNDLYLPPVH